MKVKLTPDEVVEAIKNYVKFKGFTPVLDIRTSEHNAPVSSVEIHINCTWGGKLTHVEVEVCDPDIGGGTYRSLPP